MEKELISTPLPGLDLRRHYGHFQSPAIRAGGLIFCSGMLPVDPHTGERLHGTLTNEELATIPEIANVMQLRGLKL